jgi:acyl dehydratase
MHEGITSGSEPPHRRSVNHYEDFEVGRQFRHHWGRTVTVGDAIAFATEHLLHEPALYNQVYARHLGYPDIVLSPLLVFAILLGMSVEDLSESGGPFLGADEVTSVRPVFAGSTLFASSVVVSKRASSSRPDFGVVQWQTLGHNEKGEEVLRFKRTNLVRRHKPA